MTVPYAPADQRLRAFIKYAQQIPGAMAQIKKNLQMPLPKTFLDFSSKSFGGFVDFYRNDVPQAFAEVQDAELKKQLAEVIEPAAKAMQDFGKWLAAQKPGKADAYVLGPERFAAMVRMTENVTTPVDKLEEIGRADLERNLAALAEACKRYARDATIDACIAKMNADKPTGGAVDGAREQLAELRQFIVEHDVVTIPGTEEAKVMEAPAYRRQNFAYINIPGPYEKNLPSVYYIAPPDPIVAEGGTGSVRAGQGRSAVHVRARSVAGPLPAVPALQSRLVALRPAVRRLRVRGGLGALRRGADDREGSRERRARAAHRPAVERAAA